MTVLRRSGAREPLFIDGPAGRIFAVHHPPAKGSARGAVLHVPPFAEEMNRCRRMASLQAEALSEAGFSVLLLDLFGTGDSGGDFAQARWEIWLGDVAAGIEWLLDRGHPGVTLWGTRMGALLTAAVTTRRDDVNHLILWQPIAEGKSLVTQFLRIRVAASMADSQGPAKTEGLRAELREKGVIEVGGYELSAALAADLELVRLGALQLRPELAVDWLEVGAQEEERVMPASARVVSAWREGGLRVSARTVAGEPFWATQEIALAPALLRATTDALTS